PYLSFGSLGRSPRSTLVPYTTLFRSVGEHRRRLGREPHGGLLGDVERQVTDDAQNLVDEHRLRRGFEHVHLVFGGLEARHRVGQDRKSTRLNSSHVKISYAVFCLKKK